MIRYLFNIAPGPLWARSVVAAVLAGSVTAGLFVWVFPWLEPLLPFNGQTVG